MLQVNNKWKKVKPGAKVKEPLLKSLFIKEINTIPFQGSGESPVETWFAGGLPLRTERYPLNRYHCPPPLTARFHVGIESRLSPTPIRHGLVAKWPKRNPNDEASQIGFSYHSYSLSIEVLQKT